MGIQEIDARDSIVITSENARLGCIHTVFLSDKESIELTIPAGIRNGQVMRLKGKGHCGQSTGRCGDLYLTVWIEGERRESTGSAKKQSIEDKQSRKKQLLVVLALGLALVAALAALATQISFRQNSATPGPLDSSSTNNLKQNKRDAGSSMVDEYTEDDTHANSDLNSVKELDSEYTEWDDSSINEETLEKLCEAGVFGNSVGSGRDYTKSIIQARMTVGNTTLRDYRQLRDWFLKNCPDGW